MHQRRPGLGYRWGTAGACEQVSVPPCGTAEPGARLDCGGLRIRRPQAGGARHCRVVTFARSFTSGGALGKAPSDIGRQGTPVDPQVARVDCARAGAHGPRDRSRHPGICRSRPPGTEAATVSGSSCQPRPPGPVHGLSEGAQTRPAGPREATTGIEGNSRGGTPRQGPQGSLEGHRGLATAVVRLP